MQKEGKPLNPIKLEADISQMKLDKKKLFFNRLKRRVLKHTWVLRSFFLAGVILILYLVILSSARYIGRTNVGYYFALTRDFIFTPEGKITSQEGRTNILILGKGGEGHEAPDLTDTLVLASVDFDKNAVSFLSIPRDIWIESLRIKLNSAYYWGNERQENGGLILAKSSVEEIIGSPVHYAVVIDFVLFKDLIDEVGGIEVDVEDSFVDHRYPIPGRENDECDDDPKFLCRYETIEFRKGLQFMDGDTALKFVRSRNAEGDEGTDIARSKRQQKVILSLKNGILSWNIIFSFNKLSNIKELVGSRTETDMDTIASVIVARKIFDARNNFRTLSIPEEFLEVAPKSPDFDNLYVFIPSAGNWMELQRWIKSN